MTDATDLDPDAVWERFTAYAASRGITPYPHQEEAVLELLSGSHVVLGTPTGSGKSLVAVGGVMAALDRGEVAFYTAPTKALVNEKFFDLCRVFGAQDVGMLTGDASVNPDAPIIACTAEILANIALREGDRADVGLVVMDEFHYYGDPDRGWAWQVPLLELPQAQLLLMSATLGDMSEIAADLIERTGRAVALVTDAPRPVPLSYAWSTDPLDETLTRLVETHETPVYVVHQTQAAAAEHAASLRASLASPPAARAEIAQRLATVRFAAGFGRTLSALLRRGIGVHHAGMLPRYRRIVEQLAQDGLLTVICGTDTLGVGINVPIHTVLFTSLTKFDGHRQRILRAREFHQIAGRAGRAGFDTSGYVVVQAPEFAIDNLRAVEKVKAKHGDDPRRLRSIQRKKPPEGFVVWTEQIFDKLVAAAPEQLRPHMRVDNAMILNVVARHGDPVATLSRLTRGGHESPAAGARLARRAIRLGRSLLDSGVLVRLPEPDADGRTVALTVDLPSGFALNQPLAHFALAALELLEPADAELEQASAARPDRHALDVISVVESVLDSPMPVLLQQRWVARGEEVARLKADGVDYEERITAVEEISWPQPLADLLEPAFEAYRQVHPWLPVDALAPKSILREMWEAGMSFTDFVRRYQLARSEGVVLRYLTDAYRTLRQTVPAAHRDAALEEILDWLGETIRQTDSSLLDEWEALTDPQRLAARTAEGDAPAPPQRPVTANANGFRAMVRQSVWRRVELAARDDVAALGELEAATAALGDPPLPVTMTADAWDEALGRYWDEHDEIGVDADARGPAYLLVDTTPVTDAPGRHWSVRQTLADPAGDRDWVIEADVDLDASDEAGEAVVLTTALRQL